MTRSLPPLNGLRAFEAAARHLSFAKAAEELFVTPAAISQQVKGLEERLGISLFQRVTRGLRLTPAGRRLLPGLTEGFDKMADAVASVAAPADDGTLAVSTLPSFATSWLVPRLASFSEAHGDVRLTPIGNHDHNGFQRWRGCRHPGTAAKHLKAYLTKNSSVKLYFRFALPRWWKNTGYNGQRICAEPPSSARSIPTAHPTTVGNCGFGKPA